MTYSLDQISCEAYISFPSWPSYHLVIAASVETLRYSAHPAPCLSYAVFLERDPLICDSCHVYRKSRGSGTETALRRHELQSQIFSVLIHGGWSGLVSLTISKLYLNVCYFEPLSQQSVRAQSQACHWRRRSRRACSGSGLGMLLLGSGNLVNKTLSSLPAWLVLTMKVVLFGPVTPHP